MLRMKTCWLCDEPATSWSGHLHDEAGEHVLAGHCENHWEMVATAESSILPAIAAMFPNRARARAQLTKDALPGCPGCFGKLPPGKQIEARKVAVETVNNDDA